MLNTSRILTACVALSVAALSACTNTRDLNANNACANSGARLAAVKDVGKLDEIRGHIETTIESLIDNNRGGSCSAVLVSGNEIASINGIGDPGVASDPAALGQDWPVGTMYYVGSISKTVTALAILRMIDAERNTPNPSITLDDRIDRHLSSDELVDPSWGALTIRELLAHTGDLARNPDASPCCDEADQPNVPGGGAHPALHPRYALATWRDHVDPNLIATSNRTFARYSNVGYTLLGLIIDKRASAGLSANASGYERYTMDNIGYNGGTLTGPVLTSMCLGTPWRAPNVELLAQATDQNGNAISVYDGNGWEGPSGGWMMTIGDLGRLMIVIQDELRLSSELTAEMMSGTGFSAATLNGDIGSEFGSYGLGVALGPSSGPTVFGKAGSIRGYTSQFKYFRQAQVGAGILCSQDSVPHETLIDAVDQLVAPCLGDNPPAFCPPSGPIIGLD